MVMITAGRCSPIPSIDNSDPDTTDTDNGTNVNYKCKKGYEFKDGEPDIDTREIICMNGEWNETDPPDCYSKHLIITGLVKFYF